MSDKKLNGKAGLSWATLNKLIGPSIAVLVAIIGSVGGNALVVWYRVGVLETRVGIHSADAEKCNDAQDGVLAKHETRLDAAESDIKVLQAAE